MVDKWKKVRRAEIDRLEQTSEGEKNWKKWGPYLSERQWGTVREDYSTNGDAWNYFTHDQARSRAYRWGEDGIGGISDEHQILCFSLALWNGCDPILKERLFGLSNSEGNHGEDVKEIYYYIDSTPTHSYMKYLYKYPQKPFPYADLVDTNRARSKTDLEYELIDTGVFDDDAYFDVYVEYAKADTHDMCIKITAYNRGDKPAPLHILPTLLFRNTWSWHHSKQNGAAAHCKPEMHRIAGPSGTSVVHTHHNDPLFQETMKDYYLYCEGNVPLLFCENETNNQRLFGSENESAHTKDGIGNYVIYGDREACDVNGQGTKVSPHYDLTIAPGSYKTVKLRLCKLAPDVLTAPFADFDKIMEVRLGEADDFYNSIYTDELAQDTERRRIYRKAMAGMLWSKQYFYYDLDRWLKEHNGGFLGDFNASRTQRNNDWYHMYNDDIISMPDKWEYPWYAAWDLAFHTIPYGTIDIDFAKEQLDLMLRNDYQHPNGQLPAYEWNFSDVNPPVHAFATMETYLFDKERRSGQGDIDFLKYAFTKLMVNYGWWINRKDPTGRNVFEGGFLGLDNIGVFDRSAPLPTGGRLEQADGTAWMAFFSQQMLRIAIEVAMHDPLYEEMAVRFLQHTLWIAGAMDRGDESRDSLWDDDDGFFYDVMRLPDGSATRLKVRSMVGLLPLAAVAVIEESYMDKLPFFSKLSNDFMARHSELCSQIHLPSKPGVANRRMLAVVSRDKLRRILHRMLDENEFLSPYGIRSLSAYHRDHPFVYKLGDTEFKVEYMPGESDNGMFGGNSNWRGPIWMPVNFLIVKALYLYYSYYGDDFMIECPTGSGNMMNLMQVANEISDRLTKIFLPDEDGRRPVYGGAEKFQTDPHFKDHILFYEYFHGDNGAGLGASHQTGWTGLIARMMRLETILTEEMLLSPRAGNKARKALMAHWNE